MYRYGKIIHEKVIQELSDNGLVEILDSKYLKLIPRNILCIRRSDRFDVQDWGEWKKISEIVFKGIIILVSIADGLIVKWR